MDKLGEEVAELNGAIEESLFAAGFLTRVSQYRGEYRISSVVGSAVVHIIYPVKLGADEVVKRAVAMLDRMNGGQS